LARQIPDVAHRLQANILALADLVGEVLDLARFDATHLNLRISEFTLNDLLTEESANARPWAEAKGLWLKVQMSKAKLRLRSDRSKLVRIVANLLGNAIKYTDAGGVTVCFSREPDGDPLIHVADTGIGVAPEQLEYIFDEFVQLHNPEGDRHKGYGLGLAICRRLVEALGGRITVESQLGQGSRFTVRLPPSSIVDTPGDAPATPTCPAHLTQGAG